MTNFGYTLMTEQSGPKDLVRQAVSAEDCGFDFEVCSDHFSPWLTSQGHAPNAWAVPGAVAQATERVDLYTYVTCPTMRYHPAIVAQQAATVQTLSDRRFTEWHAARQAANLAGGGRVVGQIPVSWDPDRDAAVERAHDQFRWFAGGWEVNADLPTPAGFAGATQFVRPEDVAENIPCGPDLDAIVDAVRPYWEAGFTDVALVQIGGEARDLFLKEVAQPLLETLRDASG
jgi:Luciferase-like monooxygenase